MKIDGKVQLADSLENAKFTSMAWTHDNKGLFYNVSLPITTNLPNKPLHTSSNQGHVASDTIVIFFILHNFISHVLAVLHNY